MANATMQALQTHAEKLNQQVAEVNASIKALGDVPDDSPALQEYRKQLRRLNSDLKDVNTTMKDYTRGVKAAGELYRHYAMGNIEDMSIKAIRAGVNGMKKRLDNLKAGGDPGDAEEMRLIEAITTEADVVVKRFKTDYQNVVEEIARGGTVTEQTLKRTRDGLADLMQTAETEAEKNELTNYWQKVGAAIEAVAVENRRLRGEVADREEAMRIAYATDHDGSQQAIRDAEARADAARRENDELRQRLDLKQQQRRELEQEMDINSMQVRSLMDRRDELKAQEKEDRAIRNQRVDDANKELNAARRAAKTQQQAYDEQKQTVEKLRTEVQGLTDDIRKMGEVKAEPKIDTGQIKKLEQELESLKKDLTDATTDLNRSQGNLAESLKPLEELGLKEADLEDKAKLRAAAEQKVLEIMEAQANVEKEVAEQSRKIISGLKPNALGGTKADQDFYAKNKNAYAIDDNIDDVMERIAHLETVSKLKNGRKFSDDTYWDPDDELDESEAIVMTDKEKQNALDELRVLKQHVREVILKAIREVGDVDKAVLEVTGGDGVAEDTKFGEQINDKISDLKDKIQEQITTTLESYEDILDEVDRDEKLSKQDVERRVNSHIEYLKENVARDRDDIDYFQGKVSDANTAIAAKEKEIELTKQQATATAAQSASSEQLAQKQEQLSQKTAELNQQQDKLNGMVDETVTANQRLARAEQEQTDARNAQAEAKKHEGEAVKKVEDELRGLTDEQLKNAHAYSHLTEEINTDTAAMQRNITTEQEATREADRLRSGSIDKMEQALARLRESNRKLDPTIDKEEWERGERAIGQITLRLEELKKQSAELRGEWMTVADAMKYADSIGTEGFVTTDAETKKATEALQRQRETLVSLIHEKERDGDATADERQELALLESALAKISTGFADADDVMRRFNQHMGESKTASEGMGHAFDEATSARISDIDENIKQVSEIIKDAEEDVKRDEEMIARLEKEMKNLQTLYNNGVKYIPGIGKAYKKAIEKKRDLLEGNDEDEFGWKPGLKQDQENLALWKERLKDLKQERAETIQQAAAEQEVQKARRMTREEMQEGIKVLEAEAMAQDRSTADGQKRWEELRKTIGEMSQELKEATGEWMKLADAQKIAEGAGKKGFAASAQEIQLATQALERRREELIKQIRAERDLGNAVDAQEKELDDLTKKLRSLKFEQDNVNMSQEKMRTLIETPANAVNLDELRAAIKRADGQLRQMQQSLGENSSEYKRFAEQVRNAKNVMKEMEGQAKASATAWEKAFSRLKTYVVMYMGFNEVWQKVTGTARDLMDLSDRMGEVRKTTGFTADEVGRLSDNLKKMDVRTSLTSLMEISASAGQLGLKTLEDVQGFTEAANKLMIALPEMGREAATEMMRVAIATGEVDKIRKQLQEGTIEGSSATAVAMEKIASTIDRLRASSASTAPEITDFVKRVGAVGAQSGITIDQVAALGSTVSSLGMRVEMSATALSRMIPAIRRNAFDVAHAIGMAPEALRKMFDEAGGGMNAMLEIFQHIKDAGMDEDDIEKMLGMGDMAEIMKELNQQGARAGIVFSGLSQNVDELRRQLGVANQAYDENIAIQQEFDKMNETTAAKWERLKNQFEEMFVGDEAQQWLGKIIDGARVAVDVIEALQGYIVRIAAAFALWKVGVGGAIWTYLINPIKLAATGVHSLDFQVKGLAATWRTAWKSMDAATKANWIAALASAFYMLGKYIYDTATRVSELQQELNRLDIETDDAVSHVGRLVTAFNDSSVKAEAAAKKQADLQAQTDRLSKEVDKLKKSTDEGTASTDELKRKQAELEEKEKELKKATDESNKANQARSNLISEMNSKYSTYLGYMLNEKTAAEQVASAHQLIVAALKEERKQKGLNALHDAVDKEYADDIKEYSENSQEELSGIARDAQRRIMDQWRRVLTAVTPDAKTGNFTLAAVDGVTKGGTYGSEAELKAAMRSALRDIVRTEAGGKNDRVKVSTWAGTKYKSLDDYLDDIWGGGTDDGFGDWAETYINRERDIAKATHDNQVEVNQAHKERIEAAVKDQRTNLENLQKLAKDNNQFTDDQIRQMAQDVNALVAGFDHFGEELSGADEIFGKDKDRTLQNAVNNVLASLDQKTRARVFRVAQKGQKSTNGTGSVPVPSGSNAWGSNAPADSTDYSLFDVNELVARRNQMDKFKNILKPDTDVRTVLAEDKALMKALDNGLKSDWKSVLDWYNAERKKIQDELKSERFSTNTGHWRDEKNGRGRKNRFRESDYALAELDRYYSRRKEKLEKAREEEGMSEELFNREAELLEQEHLERRSKLRETFTAGTSKQEQEMVKQFRLWWDKLEKSGDLDEVPWATVESEWAKALASEIGRNNLKAQQDLTQLQSITVKHLNAIAKLIDQERPYDGITANLRKNLTEMDILLADMVKDGPAEDTAKLVSEQGRRLQFLLTEAEHAYALTFDDLQKKMREQGLGDWADALMIDEQKKQSLMQNLRNVYDQIQEAIKKESSIIKKQLEIQWNDMLPGQEMSMKGTFEKAISDLGLAGDQVKRANSLIGAGAASERVADKLAIQQMKVQLAMQQTYFALMQKIGDERVRQLRLSAEANDRDAKALKAKAEQLRKEGKETEAETTELRAQIAARQALQDSFDAEHAQKSLNLAKTKEIAEEEKQRVAIQNQLEESQNRLYTELREWADLLTSSLQGVFEASAAGNREYYNELAKMNLTGKGGPGAGTYMVIENEGTDEARAHYEYLDQREALERQHEIEIQNAQADAWKKLMDDLNQKMAEQVTDWMNAAALDANTQALWANTEALMQTMSTTENDGTAVSKLEPISQEEAHKFVEGMGDNPMQFWTDLAGGKTPEAVKGQPEAAPAGDVKAPQPELVQNTDAITGLTSAVTQLTERIGTSSPEGTETASPEEMAAAATEGRAALPGEEGSVTPQWPMTEEQVEVIKENTTTLWEHHADAGIEAMQRMAEATADLPSGITDPWPKSEDEVNRKNELHQAAWGGLADIAGTALDKIVEGQGKVQKGEEDTEKKMVKGSQSMFAKMTQAANLYGVAYQAMSNDNLSTAQKFEMIALQAAGNTAIAAMTADFSENMTKTTNTLPQILAKCLGINPIYGPVLFAGLSAVIGGLMGMAASKLAKGKAEVAKVTGASASAGRLSTGMMTYAEGNVNELTDPASLTPGRQYNVDGADGKTYRARYMGKGAKTHITNGPEFHLVGEAGREAIIDAKTTRLLQMNETGIWRDIQTLYNGGSISGLSTRRHRGTGVRAFADGNVGEFEDAMGGDAIAANGTDLGFDPIALQSSLDANTAVQQALLERLNQPIVAVNKWTGSDGIPAMYNKMQKEAQHHGEKYM